MSKKIKYIITTPYGNVYEMSKEGYILKYSNGLNKIESNEREQKTWTVLGIIEIKPFNHLGELIPLSEAVKLKTFSFKNGSPKYTIVDLDHGTRRIVGNWKYHGVSKVYIN